MADDETKKPLVPEVAGIEKDYDLFSGWLPNSFQNPDPVLKTEGRGRGIKLYDEALRDPHVRSTFGTRILAVTGSPWDVLPASDKRQDKKIAAFVKGNFLGCNFRQACKALLMGIFKGYAVAEVMWKVKGEEFWIDRILGRAQHRFVFDHQGRPRLLTLQNLIEGEELPERKFIVFSWGSSWANPYGDALGNSAWWPVWFKKHGIKWWAVFSEKFGSPTVVGKYPPGASPEQQRALLDALEAIQQETGIKIPDTMMIELLEAQRSGTIDCYESFCTFQDNSISKLILGQTLTTQVGDTGSYAASKTQEGVRQDVKEDDAGEIDDCLNETVVRWLVDANFPAADRTDYPKVVHKVQPPEDLKALAERDKIIVGEIGLDDVPKRYFHETYNLPTASEADPPVIAPQVPALGAAFDEAEKKSPSSATWSRGSGGLTRW